MSGKWSVRTGSSGKEARLERDLVVLGLQMAADSLRAEESTDGHNIVRKGFEPSESRPACGEAGDSERTKDVQGCFQGQKVVRSVKCHQKARQRNKSCTLDFAKMRSSW